MKVSVTVQMRVPNPELVGEWVKVVGFDYDEHKSIDFIGRVVQVDMTTISIATVPNQTLPYAVKLHHLPVSKFEPNIDDDSEEMAYQMFTVDGKHLFEF